MAKLFVLPQPIIKALLNIFLFCCNINADLIHYIYIRRDFMYKEITCARCGKILEFVKSGAVQLGRETMFLDRDYEKDFLPVDIYLCPECGEYHFIKCEPCKKEELIKCKWCCKMVDPTYPHCPNCGHDPKNW